MSRQPRMTSAETERKMIEVKKLRDQGLSPSEIQEQTGLTINQYTNICAKIKKRQGISLGDMQIIDQNEVLRKNLKDATDKLGELQAAIATLDDGVKVLIVEAIKRNRRKAIQSEMEEELRKVEARYNEIIEEEVIF